MRRKSLIILTLFACFTIIFSSCKKSVENKIDGTWRKVNLENVNANVFEDWTFTGNYFYVLHTNGIGGYDTISNGTYAIKMKLFKRYLSIETSTDNSIIDDWRIDKITKGQLVIYRQQGGLEYYEFSR